jgi:hypothetical protein
MYTVKWLFCRKEYTLPTTIVTPPANRVPNTDVSAVRRSSNIHKDTYIHTLASCVALDQAASAGKSGPEMMALITPLPSSLCPVRVAWKATIASLKG